MKEKTEYCLEINYYTECETLNSYINTERTNKYAAASVKKRLTKCYMVESLNHRGIIDPSKKYNLEVEWSCDRKHDPDNIFFGIKFILDGMVEAGIINKDNQNHIGRISHTINKSKEYRIQVRFYEHR